MSSSRRARRVAIVHDWLTGMRGGEKCLVEFLDVLGEADLFTLVHLPGSCCEAIERRRIATSPLGGLPGVGRYYRHLLPAMPFAAERLDLGDYDLVLSSSHCVAKGFGGRRAEQLHVCYCYSPMRYVWDVGRDYSSRMGLSGAALAAMRPWLRAWDRRSAGRVDRFIAISETIRERIARCYGRDADVLYPPVDTEFYTPAETPREDWYLVVSAFAPYKCVDHALAACGKTGRRLKVIGSGQDLVRLRRQTPGNVELLGWRSDEEIREHYRRCRALLFPGLEDFGIVPLEAAACGAPVIAYGAGGAAETVIDMEDDRTPTGLHYRPQSVEGLIDALERFEGLLDRFDPAAARARAEEFSRERFAREFRELWQRYVREFRARSPRG